jgi:O-antigen ligase
MGAARYALIAGIGIAAAFQLWRVPRLWAFVLLFIVLVPKFPIAAVPGDPTPIRIDDLVMAAVLGGWIVARLLGRPRVVPRAPVTPFLLLYGLVALVTSLLGIGAEIARPATAAFHFMRLVEFALLYYFFYTSIDPGELPQVVRVFRFALLATVAVWVIQHWTAQVVLTSTIGWDTLYPAFSATYDFGGYVMLATIVLYALWSTGANRSVLTTIGLAAGVYLLLNADSRASFLGLAVAVGFDLFLRLRWQVALGLLVVGSATPYLINSRKMEGLLNIAIALATSFSPDTLEQSFLSDPSIGLRLRNWQMALDRWAERPLVGDGLGAYLQFVRIYDQPGTPDGWYVRLLSESGLLGLLAFVLLIGGMIWMLLRAYASETAPLRRAIVYGAALAVIATSAHALLIDSFVSYKIMGVFWMIVAVGTRVAAEPQPQAA